MFSEANSKIITVLLPVFNAMPFLPQCIESLLDQTEKRITILVIDDGSTDGSSDYLRSLKDKRISIFKKDKSGLVDTLNFGLKHISTKYVARMDADDICETNRLEKQLKFLIENPKHILVGTSANHIGEYINSKSAWSIYMPRDHNMIMDALRIRRSAIIHPTIMGITQSFIAVGGYENEAWPAEDYDLYFKLGKKGLLANIQEELYSIRLHDRSITAKNIIINQRKYELIRKKHLSSKNHQTSTGLRAKIADLLRNFDYLSVFFYRKGITRYVNKKKLTGLSLVTASAFLSPTRSVLYLKRKIDNLKKD